VHFDRCLGVFDTVGSVGLPEELRFNRKMKRLFSFPDTDLGAHVENAFHAMALDERRSDFVSCR
jgi:T6SS, Phospholipase effector Tle1-like, catalytic domain